MLETAADNRHSMVGFSLPRWTTRLWIRLVAIYGVIGFAGLTVVFLTTSTILNYIAFKQTFTIANIEKALDESVPLIKSFIGVRSSEPTASAALAETIADRLLNLRTESIGPGPQFRLPVVSRRVLSVQILDAAGAVISETPQAADVAAALRSSTDQTYTYFVDRIFPGDRGEPIGQVAIAFQAQYDIVESFWFRVRHFVRAWPLMLTTILFMGLVSGIIAARYVSNRLSEIDQASLRWADGDFHHRIDVQSDDEFGQHSHRLNAMAEQLQSSLQFRQAIAVTEERHRVSRDLHDTVKQNLFALGLQIAVIQKKARANEPVDQHMHEASTLISGAQRDLMTIINQLRHVQEDGSFSDRIDELLAAYRRRFNVAIVLKIAGKSDVPQQLQENLLQILREAIANAIRHGHASSIVVTLLFRGEEARLEVSDDGRGFDKATANQGHGLRSMSERTIQLPDGEFDVSSSPGRGTIVQVSWTYRGHDG